MQTDIQKQKKEQVIIKELRIFPRAKEASTSSRRDWFKKKKKKKKIYIYI